MPADPTKTLTLTEAHPDDLALAMLHMIGAPSGGEITPEQVERATRLGMILDRFGPNDLIPIEAVMAAVDATDDAPYVGRWDFQPMDGSYGLPHDTEGWRAEIMPAPALGLPQITPWLACVYHVKPRQWPAGWTADRWEWGVSYPVINAARATEVMLHGRPYNSDNGAARSWGEATQRAALALECAIAATRRYLAKIEAAIPDQRAISADEDARVSIRTAAFGEEKRLLFRRSGIRAALAPFDAASDAKAMGKAPDAPDAPAGK